MHVEKIIVPYWVVSSSMPFFFVVAVAMKIIFIDAVMSAGPSVPQTWRD